VSLSVTAIVPTYNYAHFVSRAIESVLAQTYTPIECLVVDDGSTDETPAVLARFGARIRVVRKQNAGLSAARNAGIAVAQGELVGLLDADDWWEPEKIARQVALFDVRPALAAVGCGVRWQRPAGSAERAHPTWRAPAPLGTQADNLRAIAVRKLTIGGSGSGLLARRAIFEQVGPFDTSLRAAEDWDMWLRIAARHLIDNVPEPLTNIFEHRTGMFRKARLMEENQWRVYEKAIAAWPDVLDWRTRRQMRALILSAAGDEFVGAGDLDQAVRRYWASVWAWPLPLSWRFRPMALATARVARNRLLRRGGGSEL
jgi:glycosyltransferase involved in cell wall biosynthesis